MVTGTFGQYEQFKDAQRLFENWTASAGEPVPSPVLFLSLPGDFVVMAIFAHVDIVLKFGDVNQPVSFLADFPSAVEVHALTVR